jgi:hypothetical protein
VIRLPQFVKRILLGAVAIMLLITLSYITLLAYGWTDPIKQAEKQLRENMGSTNSPEEIYALLTEGTWGGIGQRYLLVFRDRVLLHCDDGNGRTRERELNKDEFAKLQEWISANKVDQLPKFDEGADDGIQYEYFHIQRNGSEHRVWMNNPPSAPIGAGAVFFGGKTAPNRKLYGELTQRMLDLDRVPMHVIYPALEKLPDFHVVNAKETAEISYIAMRNNQLVAGVYHSYDKPLEWHPISASGLAKEFVVEKKEVDPTINRYEMDKGFDVREGPLSGTRLQAEFSNMGGRKDGLWVFHKGTKPELIAEGVFGKPVLCSGGEWIIAAKTPPGKMWNVPNGVVRIHLPDKQMFDVDLPPADNFDPVAWIEARKRVLVYRQRDRDGKAGPEKPEFYLLDPATGAHEEVEGEMRPFFDAGKQDLQPTGNPNEFWAAIHASVVDPKLQTTVIGRFDSDHFQFTPVVDFPDIHFDSSNFFVDQAAQTIWVALNGDLLRLSLSK